jgi:hypothetical protein
MEEVEDKRVEIIGVEIVEKIEGGIQIRTRERIQAILVVRVDFQKYDDAAWGFSFHLAHVKIFL